ncbi:hypothetical protein AJ78_08651, partial [Emergomyces pasteurianus Ep9510]
QNTTALQIEELNINTLLNLSCTLCLKPEETLCMRSLWRADT